MNAAIQKLIDTATTTTTANERPAAEIIWTLEYTQLGRHEEEEKSISLSFHDRVICFPPPSLGIAFDDGTIDMVKEAWDKIMGNNHQQEFMVFEDREAMSTYD